jgi:hypothetical protein
VRITEYRIDFYGYRMKESEAQADWPRRMQLRILSEWRLNG